MASLHHSRLYHLYDTRLLENRKNHSLELGIPIWEKKNSVFIPAVQITNIQRKGNQKEAKLRGIRGGSG